MKILKNKKYRSKILLKYSKILKKLHYGYEENMSYCLGYIASLYHHKKVNKAERIILEKIFAQDISDIENLGGRYLINNKGQVEDYDL